MFNFFKKFGTVETAKKDLSTQIFFNAISNYGYRNTLIEKYIAQKCYVGAFYKAADFISKSIENLEWNIVNVKTRKIENGKYTERLYRPCASLTWEDLIYVTTFNYIFDGDAFWYLDGESKINGLSRILIIPPMNVSDWFDGKIKKGYTLELGDTRRNAPFEEIIHFKNPDPRNPFGRGLSLLKTGFMFFEAEEAINDYRKALYGNKGILSGLIKGGNAAQNKELVEQFNEKFGGLSKSNQFAGTPSGYEFQPLSATPQDLDFTNIIEQTKADIYEHCGIPQILIGKTEHVNRSNMEEAKTVYHLYTKTPIANRLANTIARYFLPDELDFVYNLELEMSPADKIQYEKLDLDYGVRSRAEIRTQERGLEPYAGSEKILIQGIFSEVGSTDKSKSVKPEILNEQKIQNIITAKSALDLGEKSWKYFIEWEQKLEEGLSNELRKTWNWLGNKVASNLSKSSKSMNMDLLFSETLIDLDVLISEFEKGNAYIEKSMIEAIKQKELEFKISIAENVKENYIGSHIQGMEETWKGIAETDIKQLKAIMEQGINEGKTVKEIAKEINNRYTPTSEDFINNGRATAISRTEVSRAANKASHNIILETGASEHGWFTALDERVRITHAVMHGTMLPISVSFIVGGEELQYPGDDRGSAENVICCRCIEFIK
ncbi:MAG TPA: phage portal protein [Ignavibacteria bacterium]|nr:phage portal protein [Ignavibacteria bacterium]